MNYRSAMVFGEAYMIEDADEKEARMRAFIEGLWPGRWDMLRPATSQEMKAPSILGMKIDEAASKIR